jgi:hypothetical protein
VILRFALLALIGGRRRALALLGLAFVALRWLYRRRRRKPAETPPVARPVGGTSVVGVVAEGAGNETTSKHIRPADATTARRDVPEPS